MTHKSRITGVEQCISDITECPICNEVLLDNRCLPCLHTFCLKCLESYKKGKPKGKTLSCPICRREFSIPKYVANLPRNFFVDKLIEAQNIQEENSLPKLCDICSEDSNSVQAKRFCYDCRQYLCLFCENQHKKIKATRSHQILDSTSVCDQQELAQRPTYCTAHKTKEAEVYCQDCKMIICWQCKAQSHNSHASVDVGNATKDLAAKLEEHIEEISEHLLTQQDAILKLTEREKLYMNEIDAELTNICNEISRLDRSIKENGDKLKKALTTSTSVHLNAIQALRCILESKVNELKKQKVYIEQMLHLGNVSDLCEYTDKIISKTARLAQENTCEINVPPVTHLSDLDLRDLLTGKRTDCDQQYCNGSRCMDNAEKDKKSYLQDELPTDKTKGSFKGKAAECKSADNLDEELSESEDSNTLKMVVASGNTSDILLKDPRNDPDIKQTTDAENPAGDSSSKYKAWTLTRTIRTEDRLAVCGITVIDSVLYIVSQNSNYIRVYSLTELAFLSNMTVDGLVNPNDIVSCKFNNCLYTCDWSKSSIFRVKIRNAQQLYWNTDGDTGCLSVTAEYNILLAGYMSNKLKEYTPKGKLIRSISLEVGCKPWHSIKLVSNDFLICQGDNSSELQRVCLVDLTGKIKITFGGVMGSDEEHLCGPYHVAVDKSGCTLVNDCNNRRILLLSPSLKFLKVVISSSAKVLRRARRIYLDEDGGRLYVADNVTKDGEAKDGRILVFTFP